QGNAKMGERQQATLEILNDEIQELPILTPSPPDIVIEPTCETQKPNEQQVIELIYNNPEICKTLEIFKTLEISPSQLQFAESDYTADEEEGEIIITVKRTGNSENEISINYKVLEGTATHSDYNIQNDTLIWEAGDEDEKTLTIFISNDNEIENEETLHLILFNPSKSIVLIQPSTTLNIIDSTPLPNLEQGMLIDSSHEIIDSDTYFTGGISVNGQAYQNDFDLLLSSHQQYNIIGKITIDKNLLPEKADILVVAGYTPSHSSETLYMFTPGGIPIVWDKNLDNLLPFKRKVILQETLTVNIYKGELPPGKIRVFFGYRFENGEIVFNGNQPIEVNVRTLPSFTQNLRLFEK
ncbi:Calx-beta domain-containing protein, partial [Candidatus Marithioploca araucensis]|nr:Calx-beta domain-containing protein [Candidatus Marithioploca araucensis]